MPHKSCWREHLDWRNPGWKKGTLKK
ncbi:hypothetical protein A2U01_0099241, partial [Trifolium medium]|nr:hypothetical protein [Trifolium medium]